MTQLYITNLLKVAVIKNLEATSVDRSMFTSFMISSTESRGVLRGGDMALTSPLRVMLAGLSDAGTARPCVAGQVRENEWVNVCRVCACMYVYV